MTGFVELLVNLSLYCIITKSWTQSFYRLVFFQLEKVFLFLFETNCLSASLSSCTSVSEWNKKHYLCLVLTCSCRSKKSKGWISSM